MNVAVLGSTGSIGRQALKVIASHPERFRVVGLSAKNSKELLLAQAAEFGAGFVCADNLTQGELPQGVRRSASPSQLLAACGADAVVLAISGVDALKPLMTAIELGLRIAIANKESLVCAGELVQKALRGSGAELIPVDSEQSAIFQCLACGKRGELSRLILTCSGGPFWREKRENLIGIGLDRVLKHPTWSMGRKITLDSATLFNKGLEIIEAARLFNTSADETAVLIHPQSVVHSMAEFKDGTVMANLSMPDMRLPIQYALSYPERMASTVKPLRLEEYGRLEFFPVDEERFPAIAMAYEVLRRGGGAPAVYNAANEVMAYAYIDGKTDFLSIEQGVRYALDTYDNFDTVSELEDVYRADAFGRAAAAAFLNGERS